MMRLLFLCLLLLLPAATAVSEENEGSTDDGVGDDEDEDFVKMVTDVPRNRDPDTYVDKTIGSEESMDKLTLIIIVVGVSVLTLSVATIVTIILVRRRMNIQQQGIYSVPTEQDQKGFV